MANTDPWVPNLDSLVIVTAPAQPSWQDGLGHGPGYLLACHICIDKVPVVVTNGLLRARRPNKHISRVVSTNKSVVLGSKVPPPAALQGDPERVIHGHEAGRPG